MIPISPGFPYTSENSSTAAAVPGVTTSPKATAPATNAARMPMPRRCVPESSSRERRQRAMHVSQVLHHRTRHDSTGHTVKVLMMMLADVDHLTRQLDQLSLPRAIRKRDGLVPEHQGRPVGDPPPLGTGSGITYVAQFLGRCLAYTYQVRDV